MERSTFASRIGFMFAVVGSAVGLANIWRFPYIVGNYGGAAFIFVYLLCLLFIGYPILVSELLIGRAGRLNPAGSFLKLGGRPVWGLFGKATILTGFIVSCFYSAVAGWILGYFIEALSLNLTHFSHIEEAKEHFSSLLTSSFWTLGNHFLFISICTFILVKGVRGGIEAFNKVMMPLLFLTLLSLVIFGLFLPNAKEALTFLLMPNFSALTPFAILTALGQAFFTLSLGQGTMVTYGSYLNKEENLAASSWPIVLADTFVSLLSAIAVFSIVFSVGSNPGSGPGLLFETLPWVFSRLPGGAILALLFFSLTLFAAITSEISAMEPTISYLVDRFKMERKKAAFLTGGAVFLIGAPSALSFSLLSNVTLWDQNILEIMQTVASSLLIPAGGFLAVMLVGYTWGVKNALKELEKGAPHLFSRNPWLRHYFTFCFRVSAPLLILLIFINALGLLTV